MTENTNISWKTRIKKLQILFFLLLVVLYFTYGYFQNIYAKYSEKVAQLEKLEQKDIPSKMKELKEIKEKGKILDKIYSKKFIRSFISVFDRKIELGKGENKEKGNCYYFYSKNKLGNNKFSFTKCIDKLLKQENPTYDGFITKLSDKELEKVFISMGINKKRLKKFDVDQKIILASLDQNMFRFDKNKNNTTFGLNSVDSFEGRINVLSIGAPVLLDNKLQLYKASFSFSLKMDFEEFKNLLDNFQNKIYPRYNLYYTISNVSDFDIVNPNEKQNITIQGNFYFTK